MSLTLQELESEALRLPETARAQLAERLLQSLGDEEEEEVERVWLEEAKKRREDLRRNPASGIPAEEVFARLRTAS